METGPRSGAFEITLPDNNGTVLFSKLKTGRRPNMTDLTTVSTYLTNLVEKQRAGEQQQEE